MKTREYNYDLLRVISMVAVLVIHVSNVWVLELSELVRQGTEVDLLVNPIMACIYNSISRFAVPCFVMLSGAFVLDSEITMKYKQFYKKSFTKIGITTIIFSILYTLYQIPFCFLGESTGIGEFIDIAINIIQGTPSGHMWFMYMLLGLYLFAPVVVLFKNSISYNTFKKVAIILIIWASISNWTSSSVVVQWDLGRCLEYLGYFIIGYIIRKEAKKNNFKGMICILFGVLIELVVGFMQYKIEIEMVVVEKMFYHDVNSPYSPMVVLASILIFSGFAMLTVKSSELIKKIADMSFVVYLVHEGIWITLGYVFHIITGNNLVILNNIVWIPIFTLILFLISIFFSIIYNKLEYKFVRRKMEDLLG